jgi:hypothetical protein
VKLNHSATPFKGDRHWGGKGANPSLPGRSHATPEAAAATTKKLHRRLPNYLAAAGGCRPTADGGGAASSPAVFLLPPAIFLLDPVGSYQSGCPDSLVADLIGSGRVATGWWRQQQAPARLRSRRIHPLQTFMQVTGWSVLVFTYCASGPQQQRSVMSQAQKHGPRYHLLQGKGIHNVKIGYLGFPFTRMAHVQGRRTSPPRRL